MTVDGSTSTAPVTMTWTPGTSHTISVASPQSAGPATTFVRWTDGGAQTHSITAGDAPVYVAIFRDPSATGPAFATNMPATTEVSPPDGTSSGPITDVSLHWNPGCGASSFDVYCGTSTPPPLVASDVTTHWHAVGDLVAAQIYYWQIVSKNMFGDSSGTSPIWSFTPAPAAGQPDLTVTLSTITGPTTVAADGMLSLSGTVVNNGTSTPTSFRFGFYISDDANVTPEDVLWGFCTYASGLGASSGSNCSGILPVPSRLDTGTYFVAAIADSFYAVDGSNESNNGLTASNVPLTVTFTPPGALPDLIVPSLTGPPTGTIGDSIPVSATVENQGNAAAGAFQLGFYFSPDDTITTGDTASTTTCGVPGLGAGASDSSTCSGLSVAVPPGLTPGTYFLGAIVDDLSAVGESNETNNTRAADSGTVTLIRPGGIFQSGFEAGILAPWVALGSATSQVTAGAARTGSFGLEQSGGAGVAFVDVEGLVPGTAYEISAWVRLGPGGGGTPTLWVHDGPGVNSVMVPVAAGPTFQQVTLTFVVNATQKARINLRYGGGAGTVEWDDVAVRPVQFDFETGVLAPWVALGSATSQVTAGAARTGSFGLEQSGGAGVAFGCDRTADRNGLRDLGVGAAGPGRGRHTDVMGARRRNGERCRYQEAGPVPG